MVTKEEVQHIAGLARIGMEENEVAKFATELSAVLDWIKELEEVDVEGVEPTAHITGMENHLREDNAGKFENTQAIINLFPEKKNNYGKVKSVL